MAIANPIAKKFDLARLRTNEACNGFEQSAFAGSIVADESHALDMRFELRLTVHVCYKV